MFVPASYFKKKSYILSTFSCSGPCDTYIYVRHCRWWLSAPDTVRLVLLEKSAKTNFCKKGCLTFNMEQHTAHVDRTNYVHFIQFPGRNLWNEFQQIVFDESPNFILGNNMGPMTTWNWPWLTWHRCRIGCHGYNFRYTSSILFLIFFQLCHFLQERFQIRSNSIRVHFYHVVFQFIPAVKLFFANWATARSPHHILDALEPAPPPPREHLHLHLQHAGRHLPPHHGQWRIPNMERVS